MSTTQVPTCFRHPDRETYVRCTRCDRPICPDCMRDAAVGFHCVECVREGTRNNPQPRTVFGGRLAAGSRVTWTIIAVNVVMFVLQQVVPQLTVRLSMWPAAVAYGGEWYRLISAAFLHSPNGFFHILLNMWALFILGPQLEAALGRLRFVGLYLLSALGGSVLAFLAAPINTAGIGASGAIFGLFGAIFVVARRLRLDTRWIILLLVINLVITFTVPVIDWRAHVGGLLTGVALTLAYAYAPRARRTLVHSGTAAAIVVLFALLLVARTVQLLV